MNICQRIEALILPTDRVLDLGSGVLVPFQGRRVGAYHLAVDAHAPYLEQIGQPSLLGVLPDILYAPEVYEQPWDVVLLIDVLEHMEREAGIETLDRAVSLARRLVVAFTPDGWCPQGEEIGDAWGLPWTEWQRHISAFAEEDFTSRGFRTELSPIIPRAAGTTNRAVLAWRLAA